MRLKPFAHKRRVNMKKFEITAGNASLLGTAIENPANGASRKILRKIDRIMEIIDFEQKEGIELDIDDTKRIELENDDFDFVYKAFMNFSGWKGSKPLRKEALKLEDKLDLVEKDKYKFPDVKESEEPISEAAPEGNEADGGSSPTDENN